MTIVGVYCTTDKEIVDRISIHNLDKLSEHVLKYKVKVQQCSYAYRESTSLFADPSVDLETIELKIFKDNQFQSSYEDMTKICDKEKAILYLKIIFLLETNTAEAFPYKGDFLKDVSIELLKQIETRFVNKSKQSYKDAILDLSKYLDSLNLMGLKHQLNLAVSKEIFYRCLRK